VITLDHPRPHTPPVAHITYRHQHHSRRARRVFDATFATMLLTLTSPLLLLAALWIKLEDGGPVLFKQRRARPKPSDGSDPRITRAGRILRKLSIDELPQLINVIRGDMTLVGPRPEMPLMIETYERWQHMRHLVTPGLTCIWQTTSRSDIPLHQPEATALDLHYVRHASAKLDGMLIVQTVLSVLRPRGAY
jgi:lipopolysaccharide/colanic/teichoic acid biosynthesis glycosyltransferase